MKTNYVNYACLSCNAEINIPESLVKDGMVCSTCKGKLNILGRVTEQIYADGQPIQKPNLLTIELENESSVPRVFYKGEEVTKKVNVHLVWDSSDAHSAGGLTYGFEHLQKDGTVERIERRTKDHR